MYLKDRSTNYKDYVIIYIITTYTIIIMLNKLISDSFLCLDEQKNKSCKSALKGFNLKTSIIKNNTSVKKIMTRK